MPDPENHWSTERLAYLGRSLSKDMVWRRKLSDVFRRFKSDPKAVGRHKLRGEALFFCECHWGPSSQTFWAQWSFSVSKGTVSELVVDSTSDPLVDRFSWSMEEVRSHWNWVQGSSFLNNSEFSFIWRLSLNAFPLLGLNYKAGLADIPDCPRCGSGLEETAKHAFYYCERVRPFWDHIEG